MQCLSRGLCKALAGIAPLAASVAWDMSASLGANDRLCSTGLRARTSSPIALSTSAEIPRVHGFEFVVLAASSLLRCLLLLDDQENLSFQAWHGTQAVQHRLRCGLYDTATWICAQHLRRTCCEVYSGFYKLFKSGFTANAFGVADREASENKNNHCRCFCCCFCC